MTAVARRTNSSSSTASARRRVPRHVPLSLVAILALILATPSPARSVAADVLERRVKDLLEPSAGNLRTIEMTVDQPGLGQRHWIAKQARLNTDGGKWVLTVILEPPDLRGQALLAKQIDEEADEKWLYLVGKNRVRKLESFDSFQPFLQSDFSYAALGFTTLRNWRIERDGEEILDGEPAIKLVKRPPHTTVYSKIVTWIGARSELPIQREYYTPGGELWKRERFVKIAVVQGIPTPLRVTIEDLRYGGRSELEVKDIEYTDDLPDALFQPKLLHGAIDHPIWGKARADKTRDEKVR